jgi:hypothetical protein
VVRVGSESFIMPQWSVQCLLQIVVWFTSFRPMGRSFLNGVYNNDAVNNCVHFLCLGEWVNKPMCCGSLLLDLYMGSFLLLHGVWFTYYLYYTCCGKLPFSWCLWSAYFYLFLYLWEVSSLYLHPSMVYNAFKFCCCINSFVPIMGRSFLHTSME